MTEFSVRITRIMYGKHGFARMVLLQQLFKICLMLSGDVNTMMNNDGLQIRCFMNRGCYQRTDPSADGEILRWTKQ